MPIRSTGDSRTPRKFPSYKDLPPKQPDSPSEQNSDLPKEQKLRFAFEAKGLTNRREPIFYSTTIENQRGER
jgi:hypothetical protein